MLARHTLHAVAGYGIEGDRYARKAGYWSYEPRYVSEVTFVEEEILERVRGALGGNFLARESRRNVVTSGIRLDALIGRRFTIHEVEFEGERACDPCAYLDNLLGKRVRELLADRGGLRARILHGGTIRIGAPIVELPAETIATSLR
jgi:MOSC domain-containing protein YiiM